MPPELPAWRGARRRPPTRQILGLGSHRWLSRPTENAEQASTEMEPDKLLDLVTHLNNVLGEREERARAQQHQAIECCSFTAT